MIDFVRDIVSVFELDSKARSDIVRVPAVMYITGHVIAEVVSSLKVIFCTISELPEEVRNPEPDPSFETVFVVPVLLLPAIVTVFPVPKPMDDDSAPCPPESSEIVYVVLES